MHQLHQQCVSAQVEVEDGVPGVGGERSDRLDRDGAGGVHQPVEPVERLGRPLDRLRRSPDTSTTSYGMPSRSACSATAGAMSQRVTRRPCSTSTSALASPMPEAAPVTMTPLMAVEGHLHAVRGAGGDRGVGRRRVLERELVGEDPGRVQGAVLDERDEVGPGRVDRRRGHPQRDAAEQAHEDRERVRVQVVHADHRDGAAGADRGERVVEGHVLGDRVDHRVDAAPAGRLEHGLGGRALERDRARTRRRAPGGPRPGRRPAPARRPGRGRCGRRTGRPRRGRSPAPCRRGRPRRASRRPSRWPGCR